MAGLVQCEGLRAICLSSVGRCISELQIPIWAWKVSLTEPPGALESPLLLRRATKGAPSRACRPRERGPGARRDRQRCTQIHHISLPERQYSRSYMSPEGTEHALLARSRACWTVVGYYCPTGYYLLLTKFRGTDLERSRFSRTRDVQRHKWPLLNTSATHFKVL